MSPTHTETPEFDPRFPSGSWTGFFLQHWLPGRHTTELDLTAADGRLTGTGLDCVGPYTIDGSYDSATGGCEWIKQYVRKHQVRYRGTNEGHGIWGVWEIRQLGGLYLDRGGFHLWPRGSDVSEESDRTETALRELMSKNSAIEPAQRAIFSSCWRSSADSCSQSWQRLCCRTGDIDKRRRWRLSPFWTKSARTAIRHSRKRAGRQLWRRTST